MQKLVTVWRRRHGMQHGEGFSSLYALVCCRYAHHLGVLSARLAVRIAPSGAAIEALSRFGTMRRTLPTEGSGMFPLARRQSHNGILYIIAKYEYVLLHLPNIRQLAARIG